MLQFSTFLVLLYISISYVLPLYATSQPEGSKRDNPRTIKSRMQKLTIMLISNLFWCLFLQSQLSSTTSHISFKDAFLGLGIIPGYYAALPNPWQFSQFVKDLTKCVAMLLTLYCGPVLDFVLYHLLNPKSSILEDFLPWIPEYLEFQEFYICTNNWGNILHVNAFDYVLKPNTAFATKLSTVILATIAFFGLAHAHHAYEQLQEGSMTTVSILLTTCFQILYTTLLEG